MSKPSGDASNAEGLVIAARPAAILRGSSTWDEGYTNLRSAFNRIQDDLLKNGMKPAGKPLAVFIETDDLSFRFEAMGLG